MAEIASPPAVHVKPRRFTSDEVQSMLRAGILHEDDRLELIDGQLISMSPIGDPHIACINRLNRLLVERTTPNIMVSVQNPVRIDAHNEPEPDVVLTTATDRAPRPDDVLLLVEVADSSLRYDREAKLPRYAQAGIPEVWIVNLDEAQVEVHRAPKSTVYGTRHIATSGDTITIEKLPEVDAISVSDVLPEAGPSSDDAES